jgi:N utilization substance protein A
MSSEILRIVDAIHRDRDIDKELIFLGIEAALLSAARKRLGQESDFTIGIDRDTGEITAMLDDKRLAPTELGRIAALSAKQVIMQKIKEAERDVIYTEFEKKVGQVVTGTVSRFEGPKIIINVNRTEAVLPRKEQVYNESYQVGDRMKLFVYEVKKVGSKVEVVLSRAHPDLISELFRLEIPEVTEDLISIRGLAREPGYRAKIAVFTNDPKIDSVGACVGVRGSRIKSIVDELGGEKIDIVRWSEDPAAYIIEALKPAEITEITLDEDEMRAQVLVREDSLSKAIGKRGKNVRLACKLTGWEIDIVSPESIEAKEAASDKEAAAETEEEDAPAAVGEEQADETEETLDSEEQSDKILDSAELSEEADVENPVNDPETENNEGDENNVNPEEG